MRFGAGEMLKLVATPDAGWTFHHWSAGCGGDATCYFDPGNGAHVAADFRPPPYRTSWASTVVQSIGAVSGVGVNTAGNVAIAGPLRQAASAGGHALALVGGSDDIYVAYLSESDGSVTWATSFGSGGSDNVSDVLVAADGSTFVTGLFSGTLIVDGQPHSPDGSSDVYVKRFDHTGNDVGTTAIGGPTAELFSELAVDSSGEIILAIDHVSAVERRNRPNDRCSIRKLSPDWSERWAIDLLADWVFIADLVVMPNDDIIAVGTARSWLEVGTKRVSGNDLRGFAVRLDGQTGHTRWLRALPVPVTAAAGDGHGNLSFAGEYSKTVQLAGGTFQPVGASDAFVMAVDDAGAIESFLPISGTGRVGVNGLARMPTHIVVSLFTDGVVELGSDILGSVDAETRIVASFEAGGPVWSQAVSSPSIVFRRAWVALGPDGEIIHTGGYEYDIDVGGVSLSTRGRGVFAQKITRCQQLTCE